MIFSVPMIASEKSHQNPSDYKQFLFKKRFIKINKKQFFFSGETIINSDNCIYDLLTRSSERILNPKRYTDSILYWSHLSIEMDK